MKVKIIGCMFIVIIIINCFVEMSEAYSSGKVVIRSDYETIEKGDKIPITITIDNAKTTAFHFSLFFDDSKFEPVDLPENTNVIGNRILYVWYDITGGEKAKQGDLITLFFRAKEDGLATFGLEGEFYNSKGQLLKNEIEEKQIKIGKENKLENQDKEQGNNTEHSNANLQALRLNIEGITPIFNKDTYEYYLTISPVVKDIEILAISENPEAEIKIEGNQNLVMGLNFIKIQVVSPDKTKTNTYTIEVTKTSELDKANTNLEILAIENILLNPPFDTTITNYTVEVENSTNSLNVLAIPEDEDAVVEIVGKERLEEGKNYIDVVVTAKNGFTKKKYKVEAYKRNAEEEIDYKQDKEAEKQALETIYKSEETNQKSVFEEKATNNKEVWIWLSVITVLVIILISFVWYKAKLKKES